jgi:hypothetical protein
MKNKIKKVPITDMDYVELYAKSLKNNPDLFKQQKMLIESQLKASRELFMKRFGEKDFKIKAREYLRAIELIN